MAAVTAIMDALATQIAVVYSGGTATPVIDDLQVEPRLVWNPTPPAVDIYPASPFQEKVGMGAGNNELFLTVRARVNTPDHEGAQDLLLSMMDPNAPESMEQAIMANPTLGGTVDYVAVDPPTDFQAYTVPSGGDLLGCTWRVRVMP